MPFPRSVGRGLMAPSLALPTRGEARGRCLWGAWGFSRATCRALSSRVHREHLSEETCTKSRAAVRRRTGCEPRRHQRHQRHSRRTEGRRPGDPGQGPRRPADHRCRRRRHRVRDRQLRRQAVQVRAQRHALGRLQEQGAEVGAVSVSGDRLVFSTTVDGGAKKVYESVAGGAPHVIANTFKYEKTKNPDKKNTYAFLGISDKCASQLPPPLVTYTGHVDSHPYSTEQVGDTVYVGDAGGNDILSISATGKIRTVAVLPPTKLTATKALVEAMHLPTCVVGHKFGLESVPTDVEMGPDGWLYVSSLPGGPEDGSLGALGRVYKVNPGNGKVKLVADGFLGTVNVAVADNGDVYVSQLFAGQISRIPAGTSKVKKFAEVNMPAGLEWTADGLYATIDALKGTKSPKGKLAFIPFS